MTWLRFVLRYFDLKYAQKDRLLWETSVKAFLSHSVWSILPLNHPWGLLGNGLGLLSKGAGTIFPLHRESCFCRVLAENSSACNSQLTAPPVPLLQGKIELCKNYEQAYEEILNLLLKCPVQESLLCPPPPIRNIKTSLYCNNMY